MFFPASQFSPKQKKEIRKKTIYVGLHVHGYETDGTVSLIWNGIEKLCLIASNLNTFLLLSSTHSIDNYIYRDESFVEFALKMMMQVLINFSMGLVMAFFIFVFGLWSIVRSYQPNPFTAVVYFVSAVCAAFAFVSSYLLMLYGAAAGTIYGAAKLAESQRRLEGGGGGYRQQRVQYGGRPRW